jgi:hypothetical protein
MPFNVSLVVEQGVNGEVWLIGISLDIPRAGYVLIPDQEPLRYKFKWQGVRIGETHSPSRIPGHGPLFDRVFDMAESDPRLEQLSIINALVCQANNPPPFGEFQALIRFSDWSPYALVFSSHPLLDNFPSIQAEAKRLQQECLLLNTWYPIECYMNGQEMGLGVLLLDALDQETGKASGKLRFVYKQDLWVPHQHRLELRRFGKQIAQAETVET